MDYIIYRLHWGCQNAPKWLIGHLHEYAYRCQNAIMLNCENAILHRFGHVLVTNAKMPHFKGEKGMGHFGIDMHIHASDISVIAILGHLATPVYKL